MANAALQMVGHSKLGSPADLLMALFLIGLLPVLAISVTSFTRIIVVLGLLRAALGSAGLPPNSVLVALAIMLSAAIMAPTLAAINRDAIVPYQAHRLGPAQAFERASRPVRSFMAAQTRASDVAAFARIARVPRSSQADAPFSVLAPAFLVSELRSAFAMGFVLALPFAVVDIVVGMLFMSLGMFMVSPSVVSLPAKLLLFVAVDGWALVAGGLAASYHVR